MAWWAREAPPTAGPGEERVEPAKRPAKITHLPTSAEDRIERALAPFFRDVGLWPVTFVVVAHVVLAIAMLLLEAVRTPGAFGIAALSLLVIASADAWRRDLVRRRLGALGATLLVSWILGVIGAIAANRFGLY